MEDYPADPCEHADMLGRRLAGWLGATYTSAQRYSAVALSMRRRRGHLTNAVVGRSHRSAHVEPDNG